LKSVVVVHGEDFVERIFVRVDVDHPAEDDRLEPALSALMLAESSAGIRKTGSLVRMKIEIAEKNLF
jgi:hypothetical protein